MSGAASDEAPPRALVGNYVGTEVDGSWRKRYRRDGFFARGNGRYWWDEETFCFLRHLTKRALRIPFDRMTGIRVGTSHAGRLGLWLRILKIDWSDGEHELSSGFLTWRTVHEVENLAAELRARIPERAGEVQ